VSRLRRAWAWCAAPERRWLVVAVVVAFALRLAWVLWVTAEPLEATSDTGRNLTMARQFSHLETYRLFGHVSTFNPPGYPLVLTPLAFVSRVTGWFSLPFGAALFNVVAGTATVALGGALAWQWFGRRTGVVAAWALALAAGPIFLTSTALSETFFTALVLVVLVVVTGWLHDPRPPTRAAMVVMGLLLALVVEVRAPGLLLVLVAAFAVRSVVGSWHSARRPLAWLLLAFVLALVPWTIRNGVQVGVWTPFSTNNAAFLCQGHRDGAKADAAELTEADFAPCFRGTPYDPEGSDEAAWYGPTVRRAVGWAFNHPAVEVRLTWEKTFVLMRDDRQSVGDAGDSGRRPLGSPETQRRLLRASDLWHWSVLALGLAALLVDRRARRAWPIWATAAGSVVVVWGGVALDRFHHTTMALLAILAATTLVTMGRWASAGIRDTDDDAEVDDGPPPPAAEGMAQASRPSTWLAGPAGHPFQPILVALAMGAWVSSFGFDLISLVADTAWVYARGAWVLTGLGTGAALVGAFAALLDLLGVPRGTVAFRCGVRRLLTLDAALFCFAVSFLVRNGSDFEFHDHAPTLAIALSVLGLVALAATTWLDGTMTYTYGIRVATDEERQKGFEPVDD
jgi:uncharacterized membrane protein